MVPKGFSSEQHRSLQMLRLVSYDKVKCCAGSGLKERRVHTAHQPTLEPPDEWQFSRVE
jgi:hypothetical protein